MMSAIHKTILREKIGISLIKRYDRGSFFTS